MKHLRVPDMARSMIALFIAAFFFVFVAFWTGVTGCWRRSPGNIGTTAALMLLACESTCAGYSQAAPRHVGVTIATELIEIRFL